MHGGEGAAWTATTKVRHKLLMCSVFLPLSLLADLGLIVELNLISLPLSAIVMLIHRIHLVQRLFGGHVLPGEALLVEALVLLTDVLARRRPSLDHDVFLDNVRVVSLINAVV